MVIGVSFDPPSKNAQFKAEEAFLFSLWTDQERELALYYGAASSPDQFFANRHTVLLDPQGDLVLEYALPQSGAGGLYAHAQLVLDDLAVLQQ